MTHVFNRRPAAKRRCHLRAVRMLMPAASAADIRPIRAISATRWARPLGVNEAFLWVFIRGVLKRVVWLENLHLASPRVNNLLGNDT